MNERKLFQNGITLIALVISIIVMLILAGVSLNATIGDNGIITQAQNATYLQSCSALSDFLNQKYIDDELDNIVANNDDGTTKSSVEKLYDNYSDWFFKEGSNNYVIKEYTTKDSEGNSSIGFIKLRLIRKNNLPEEIKKQIVGGEANNDDTASYEQLKDVYGVTGDLQVYYCADGIESSIGANYASSASSDSYDGTKTIYSSSSDLSKAIASTFGKEAKDMSMQDLRTINELNISNDSGMTDLSALKDLPNLQTITLNNYQGSLNGIQKAYKLTSIYFNNSKKIQNIDYTGLEKVTGLQEIRFYNPNDIEVEKMCNTMKNTNYTKLKRIFIYGTWNEYWKNFYAWAGQEIISNNHSELSSLKYFNNLTKETKESVENLIFANCNLTTTEGIEEFTNVTKLRLSTNLLQNINGLQNLKKLNWLALSNNPNLTNINQLKEISTLKYIKLDSITQLSDISAILINSSPNSIDASDCNNLNFGTEVWTNNENALIKKFGKVSNLLLANKYSLLFSDREVIKVDSSADASSIMTLSGKTTLKSLSLSGNKNLSNEQLQSLLKSLPNLENVNLDSTNLSSLEFAKNKTKLRRISFRNTGVTNIIDLENNNKLGFIRFDNVKATVELYKENDETFNNKIVKIIETTYNYQCSEDNDEVMEHGGGFIPIAQVYFDNINKLINLTKFFIRYYDMTNYNIDFSGTKLKNLYVQFNNHRTIKVPSTIENISTIWRTYFSVDNITNLKQLSGNGVALIKCDNINTMFNDSQNGVTCSFRGDVLDDFKYIKDYVGPWVGSFSWSGETNVGQKYGIFDSSYLSTMTNCNSIYINCLSSNRLNGEDFENYTRDFTLELSGCKVDTFEKVNLATHLKELKLPDNRIADISFFMDGIENSNITKLNLSGNNLTNLCTYKDTNGNTISIKTTEILAKLPNLQYVDLSKNEELTDFTALKNLGFTETSENSKIFVKQ